VAGLRKENTPFIAMRVGSDALLPGGLLLHDGTPENDPLPPRSKRLQMVLSCAPQR